MLGLLCSIRINSIQKDIAVSSSLAESSARLVYMKRLSIRPLFNDDYYPRDVLDSLERDFNNYADWIESHQDYLDSHMNVLMPIDSSRIGKPEFHSSLSESKGLIEKYNNYWDEIKLYNTRATELKRLQENYTTNEYVKQSAEIFSAIFIILSSLLQILLAFCGYYNEKQSSAMSLINNLDDTSAERKGEERGGNKGSSF